MTAATLDVRLTALREVQTLGTDRVAPELLGELTALLRRADGRRALSGDHTVVGLFGATGSGKSSLFNALVGEDLAAVHVLRPTTSEPLAVTSDPAGAVPLLDWLGVRDRRTLAQPMDPRAERLILLDLPDFDSVESAHRAIAERFASQVDALVWVVDPEKYADAVLHTDFIARHARHGAVTLVVLNQIDRLGSEATPRVVDSLRGILAADGLADARVFAASARTGEGLAELRRAIGDLAASRATATARLTADVEAIAARLPDPGRPPARGSQSALTSLVEQLAVAGGADTVARAVAASYRMRSGRATGWPIVSWLLRLRPDPLRRLGLRPDPDRDPSLHRTSLPPMNAAAAARASLAVRSYAEQAAAPLTEEWRAPIRRAADDALAGLPDALDQAVARAALPARDSWWWIPVGVLQWMSIVIALAGVLWLLGLAWLPTIGIVPPAVPTVEGWPVTTLLVVGGLLLGIALGLASAGISALVAASRRRRARAAIMAEVQQVARERVVAPVAAELDRARDFGAAVERARSVPSARVGIGGHG